MDDLTTKVTEEDLNHGLNDKFGVVYSRDGKRLLKCEKNGTAKHFQKILPPNLCKKFIVLKEN